MAAPAAPHKQRPRHVQVGHALPPHHITPPHTPRAPASPCPSSPRQLRTNWFNWDAQSGEYGWSGGQMSPDGDALISWHHYLQMAPAVDASGHAATLLSHREDASGFYIPFIRWVG